VGGEYFGFVRFENFQMFGEHLLKPFVAFKEIIERSVEHKKAELGKSD